MSKRKRFQHDQRAMAPSQAIASGSVGWSAGGPLWLDDFRTKRAPNPTELVNAFKAVAYSCANLNARGVARVPLRLFAATRPGQKRPGRGVRNISRKISSRREQYVRGLSHVQQVVQGDSEIEEITEHPFLQALARPNPYFDGHGLMMYLSLCLDVVGSAYVVPTRPDPTFAASELWPLMAQYVYPVKGSGQNGQILSHYTFLGERLAPDDVVRLRHISLRDPFLSGYSPLQACFEQVGLGNYYTATVESLLKNGARPSGVLTPADPQMPGGDTEVRRLQLEVDRSFNGGNAGKVMVTQGAYNFVPFDYKPTDLGGLELSKHQRLIVANCFDVPISLLDTENSNRAVAEAGTYQHQRNAIEPRCVMIAGALTAMSTQVDDRLFFAFDSPVEEDAERRAKLVDMGIKNGTVTINEARRENGDKYVDGGDEPLLNGTFVRLKDVAADPEPVPPQLMPPTNETNPAEADEADEPTDPEEAGETPEEAQAEAEQEKQRKRRLYRAERKALRETIALLQEFRAQLQPQEASRT